MTRPTPGLKHLCNQGQRRRQFPITLSAKVARQHSRWLEGGTMGDKGGKKDKEKHKQQQERKQQEQKQSKEKARSAGPLAKPSA